MECVCVCVRVRGGVVRLKLGVQGQGSGRILDVDVQGEWGILKIGQLENFHGRHMSILLLSEFYFWKRDWILGYISIQIENFLTFPRVLRS